MARTVSLLAALVAALASSQAVADLRAPSGTDARVAGALVGPEITVTDSPGVSPTDELLAEFVIEPLPSCEPVAVDPQQDVIELPPAPGSAALFLSAMVSLGAWQLVRSGRDLHFGAAPEWYHTGAPIQIGHTTAFDFEYSPVVLSVFDAPVTAPTFSHRLARESRLRVSDQPCLCLTDPRGPPAVAN